MVSEGSMVPILKLVDHAKWLLLTEKIRRTKVRCHHHHHINSVLTITKRDFLSLLLMPHRLHSQGLHQSPPITAPVSFFILFLHLYINLLTPVTTSSFFCLSMTPCFSRYNSRAKTSYLCRLASFLIHKCPKCPKLRQ